MADDHNLGRFTKIPRVELCVADNVVDCTILKQSGIIIVIAINNLGSLKITLILIAINNLGDVDHIADQGFT